MRKLAVVLLAVGCLAVLAATTSMPIPGQVDLQAQKCGGKGQPKCGTPCSPGYWKNHLTQFNQVCGAAAALPNDPFTTCAQLLTALTCQGSDASCHRQAAAAALNTVSGCTESD